MRCVGRINSRRPGRQRRRRLMRDAVQKEALPSAAPVQQKKTFLVLPRPWTTTHLYSSATRDPADKHPAFRWLQLNPRLDAVGSLRIFLRRSLAIYFIYFVVWLKRRFEMRRWPPCVPLLVWLRKKGPPRMERMAPRPWRVALGSVVASVPDAKIRINGRTVPVTNSALRRRQMAMNPRERPARARVVCLPTRNSAPIFFSSSSTFLQKQKNKQKCS